MSAFNRLAAAAMLGWAAYSLAIGVGIPQWLNWPTQQIPADATDIGVLVAVSVLCLTRRVKP